MEGKVCTICQKTIDQRNKSGLCCFHYRKTIIGNKHPKWKGDKPQCSKCGKRLSRRKYKQCFACYCKSFLGESNPNWKNGISFYPYSRTFTNNLKLKIRTRDNFNCRCCKLKEKKHYRGKKQTKLIIHHIDYNKENCKEENLISLCLTCHLRTNGNRDYWYAYCTYLMENYEKI